MFDTVKMRLESLPRWLLVVWGLAGPFLGMVLRELLKDRAFGGVNDWLDKALGPVMSTFANGVLWLAWMAAFGGVLWFVWWLTKRDMNGHPITSTGQPASVGLNAPENTNHSGGALEAMAAERQRFVVARRKLEEAVLGAEGDVVTVKMDAMGGLKSFYIHTQEGTYKLSATPNSGQEFWIYDNLGGVTTSISPVRYAKRGELIDTRQLHSIGSPQTVKIGEHVFLKGDTDCVVQLLIIGVLATTAGDPVDEARAKFKVYPPGEFLIPAL